MSGHLEGEINMTEDKQVSNDNRADKKSAKKTFKKPIYADVSKSYKDMIDDAASEKNEVVHWSNFSPE